MPDLQLVLFCTLFSRVAYLFFLSIFMKNLIQSETNQLFESVCFRLNQI